MNNEFTKREDDLRDRWIASYPAEQQALFCYDGLIYYRDPNCKDEYAEVIKWEHAKRKVLFLLKDTNDNPNCDYRESVFYDTEERPLYRMNVVLLKWLWSLNEVTTSHLPVFDKTRKEYIQSAQRYPMAIVNIKKVSGNPSIYNATICEYYKRDRSFLKEQLREILKPTMIVCGGGSGTILEIAKNYIYDDMDFIQYNDWCYYCKESKLLLIDSYHPSARCSNELKFDRMIENVQDMLKKTETA
jgi:hypothetical protein